MSSALASGFQSAFSQVLGSGSRSVLPIITMNGIDVSSQLYSQLKKVRFRQTYADSFDTLALEIVDPDNVFMNHFNITPGITVAFSVKTVNWRFPGDSQLVQLGSFVIDEVMKNSPPDIVTIKCVDATAVGQAKWSNITRTWAGTLLSIGQQVAAEAGLQLRGNPPSVLNDLQNVPIDARPQSNCSDLVFYSELCRAHYFSTKIHSGVLWVFNEMGLDQQTPAATLTNPTVGEPGGLGVGLIQSSFVVSVQNNNFFYPNSAGNYVNVFTGKVISTDPGKNATIDSNNAKASQQLNAQPFGQKPPVVNAIRPPITPNTN